MYILLFEDLLPCMDGVLQGKFPVVEVLYGRAICAREKTHFYVGSYPREFDRSRA